MAQNAEVRAASKKRGAKGFGWLEKRGRKWYACWKRDGKLHKVTTHTSDKVEAQKQLDEWTEVFRLSDERARYAAFAEKARSVDEQISATSSEQSGIGLLAAWTVAQPEVLRGNTDTWAIDVERDYNKFCDWIKSAYPEIRNISQVTGRIADQYYDFRKTQVAILTANTMIYRLRAVWTAILKVDRKAERDAASGIENPNYKPSMVTFNPWEGVELEKAIKRSFKRELTLDELNRLYEATHGEYRLLFSIGIYTGMRLGDCATLEWGEVDLQRRRLVRVPKKTSTTSGAVVTQYISVFLYQILSEIPSSERVGYIMPHLASLYNNGRKSKGRGELYSEISRIFKRCGIQTTIDNIEGRCNKPVVVGFHSLRYTYISTILNKGGSMDIVRKSVGHASQLMTDHYWHINDQQLEDTAALLPDIRETVAGSEAQAVTPPDSLAHIKSLFNGLSVCELKQLKDYLEEKIKATETEVSQ